MLGTLRSSSKAVVLTAIFATILVVVHFTEISPLPGWQQALQRPIGGSQLFGSAPNDLSCQGLLNAPLAQDVVVVMRTGATEIEDKLPVHLNTTFRCYADTLIFSDYAETFQGHEVYDVLASVDERIKRNNDDFDLYRRLQQHGRESLQLSELSGTASWESGPVGKTDNKGWKLDKWKFLPMMVRTLELRPDKKFYVFVEPDTYVVWSNLLRWIQEIDYSRSGYYGSEVQIGEDIFAHGGSAFVMTNSALRKGVESYLSKPDYWHELTALHWAGDCILGKALAEADVPLSWTWPMFQGGNPANTMDWEEVKVQNRLWCAPALSYHHFSPSETQAMWEFEQHRASNFKWKSKEAVLHHRDVFKEFVMPSIESNRHDWTNISPSLQSDTRGISMEGCRALCEADQKCTNYALGPVGCTTGTRVFTGRPMEGVQSGWITERIEAWMAGIETCKSHEWVRT